jgi:hypothetical protein
MVTYCSADVISAWSDIDLTPYKDAITQAPLNAKYKAMQANLPNNSGMRILFLVNGQGVLGNCHL